MKKFLLKQQFSKSYLVLFVDYAIIDVETCPVTLEGYFELKEEEQKKLLNPIDSRIVAIGLRTDSKTIIFQDSDEKKMLSEFWKEMTALAKAKKPLKIVGFNIKEFDLPVLVTRSFINDVKINPFLLKDIVDLREKLSAFKYGKVRGKLKEFGAFLGVELHEMDGSQVAKECSKGNFAKIKEYLSKDLEITEKILLRAIETRIMEIERW